MMLQSDPRRLAAMVHANTQTTSRALDDNSRVTVLLRTHGAARWTGHVDAVDTAARHNGRADADTGEEAAHETRPNWDI